MKNREIANRIAELHYPNEPNVIHDKKYRLVRMKTLADQVESELNLLTIPVVTQWVAVSERTPICYKTGHWDGKMSDLVIVIDSEGKHHLAEMYEYYDGNSEWYDNEDYGLRHEVVKWKPIE